MADTQSLLEVFRALGVSVTLSSDGSQLRVRGSNEALTSELRREIARQRQALLAELHSAAQQRLRRCPCPMGHRVYVVDGVCWRCFPPFPRTPAEAGLPMLSLATRYAHVEILGRTKVELYPERIVREILAAQAETKAG